MTTARERLAEGYNSGLYNAGTNPLGLDGDGHRVNLIPAFQDIATLGQEVASNAQAAELSAQTALALAGTAISGASATAITISGDLIGTEVSFATQAGKAFVAGMPLIAGDQAAPTVRLLSGRVSSYNVATGTLVMAVAAVQGAGPCSGWAIRVDATAPRPGDLMVTMRQPTTSEPWLLADGKVYARSAHPALATQLGAALKPVAMAGPTPALSTPCYGSGWRPNGLVSSVATQASPYVANYTWASGGPVALAAPATTPTGVGRCVAWRPDGRYQAVGHDTSPFVTIYDWVSGSPVKIADPAALPVSPAIGAAWSPDGRYLAVVFTSAPYLAVYDWVSGSPVKLTNPATLPAGSGRSIAWATSGQLVVGHDTSPFVTVYDWVGGALTKMANPAVLPPSACYSTACSPDGQYLALGCTSSAATLVLYRWTSGAFVYAGDVVAAPVSTVMGLAWSPNSRFLAASHGTSPQYFFLYDILTGQLRRAAAPTSGFPTATGYQPAWRPDGTSFTVPSTSGCFYYAAFSYDPATEFMVPDYRDASGVGTTYVRTF